MSAPHRRARLLLAALAGLLLPLPGTTGAADAHPFGPPQTVEVAGAGDLVHVHWQVGGTDDLTLLGVSLGVIAEDRVMLDGAVFYEDADAGVLAAAPEFGDYLLDHVAVTSGGQPCTGTAAVTDALATDGVDLDYRCPAGAGTAEISVTTLTDLHPAYRTLATGPAGQRAVYDVDDPSHEWTLSSEAPDSDLGTSAAVQLGGVLGVLLLAGGATVVVLRRRHRPRR